MGYHRFVPANCSRRFFALWNRNSLFLWSRPFGNPRWWIAGRKRFLGSFLNRIGILRQLAGIWRVALVDFWRRRFLFFCRLGHNASILQLPLAARDRVKY